MGDIIIHGGRGGGKRVKQVVIMIHEYCKSTGKYMEGCNGCMFKKRDGCCMVGTPITWDIDELKEVSNGDTKGS